MRTLVATLREHGIVLDPKRKITLTAGSMMPGAQGTAIEMNAEHPALSGVVSAIERLLVQEESTDG